MQDNKNLKNLKGVKNQNSYPKTGYVVTDKVGHLY